MTNNPITTLERAVSDLTAFANEHPGEVESEIGRIWRCKDALLNAIHDVQETCKTARADALYRATQRHLESVS